MTYCNDLLCRNLKEVVDEGENKGMASDEESEASDLEDLVVEVKLEEKWDCESILSTYSNLYNHPRLIEEPKKVWTFTRMYKNVYLRNKWEESNFFQP